MFLLNRIKNIQGNTIISIFGWTWTVIGGLILFISVISFPIEMLHRLIPFPGQQPQSLRHAILNSIELATVGTPIIITAQATLRKKAWGWILLRVISFISLAFNLYQLTFGHEFPTSQRVAEGAAPPIITAIFLSFAIIIISIWVLFFALSFIALSTKRVKVLFNSEFSSSA
jgi:hypothetical protein